MFFYKERSQRLYMAIVFSCLFIFSFESHSIVNMNGLHFNNENNTVNNGSGKFSADVDLLFSGSSGNSDNSSTALNGQLSWITNKNINLFLFGVKEGQSNGILNTNKAFLHYRYIQSISELMDWESFAQIEKNEFTRLSSRQLLGLGLRFNISNNKNHSGFLGVGAFHSKEEIGFKVGYSDDGVETITRLNLYLFSKYNFKPSLEFSNAIYYQPDSNNFSDYRALVQSKFDFIISKKVSFRLSLDIEYDSAPSETVENSDISYTAGFKYSF